MAEMKSPTKAEPATPAEAAQSDRHSSSEHSREFLDFFWDIAKPDQETRLRATEKLLEYLRTRPNDSEMKYASKRLITGLGVGREAARPCYSSASAQSLQSFEDIPLCDISDQIQEKYSLQAMNKAMMRPSLFANLFGVLALFQSGRLVKDKEASMKSVQLSKISSQHPNHLQGQPIKASVDILSEVPESMFQEISPKVLKGNMKVILRSPKYLELFLSAKQRVPTKLESLMGSVDSFSEDNIPSSVNISKVAANSVKKEHKSPNVASDSLRSALKESRFESFWKKVLEEGSSKNPSWTSSYMCFRLSGASSPLSSEEQLQLVMRGDLIRHFGENMVISKPQNLFKIIPEISTYVGTFLEGCQDDPKRQLTMMVAFTTITNQGLPVMPTFWRVTRFLNAEASQSYVAWLRDMFSQPDSNSLVDFSTANQKRAQDASLNVPERAVFRLRKWIIHRSVSLVDHLHSEKDEAVVEQIARFCLFHAFFKTKKATPQIPETKQHFSFPLDDRNRGVFVSAFFSLSQTLSVKFRQTPDSAENGKPWTYRSVQLADMSLNHNRNVTSVTSLTTQQRQAWDQMMSTSKELEARSSETRAIAFQHSSLSVGLHIFKSPAESCDVLGDIQTCIKKSMEQNPRRSRSRAKASQEPVWVEVMVEILSSLSAQPSNLMRQVVRSVFGHICPHLTPRCSQLISAVLSPVTNEDEDDNVVVTDDADEKQSQHGEDEDSDNEDNKNSESDMDSEDGEESEEEDRDKDVDPGFRQQLMEVLKAGNALGGVDNEEEEELGDEAMMASDQNSASLFKEQKMRIQARNEEKNKLQKEKKLRRDFQIRALDSIEVSVTKQPEHPSISELLEPSSNVIQHSMRSKGSTKQEQDLSHKTARIFMHHSCRARRYCHEVGPCAEASHAQVERLVQQAGSQADASVALYYFNASSYSSRVLKGNTNKRHQDGHKLHGADTEDSEDQAANCLDLDFVTRVYSASSESLSTKRNSSLTVPMFLSLFSRYPVICKNSLPVSAQHVAGPSRPRHQAQACSMLQKTSSARESRVCFEDPEWEQSITQLLGKATQTSQTLGEAQSKGEHQKELSILESSNTSLRTVNHEKSSVDLTAPLGVLQSKQQKSQQSSQQGNHSSGSNRLYDLYWQAMRMLGVQRPKSEKKNAKDIPSDTQSPVSTKRKKKGFLPETKKRKKLKSEGTTPEKNAASQQDAVTEGAMPAATGKDQPPSTGKKKRKRVKASTPSQVNGITGAKSPAPSNPTLSPSTPAKTPKSQKKKEKSSQVNGATPVSPIEPESKKHHQEALSTKEVIRKSPHPQSASPKKRARSSSVSRSPSSLQSGVKKRRVASRRVQTP